jgi:hypothetical protein
VGTLHLASGELAQAEACHQQALVLARAVGGASEQAHALAGLGRCAIIDGDIARGSALLQQALEIFRRIGAAEVPGLVTELATLTDPPHAH